MLLFKVQDVHQRCRWLVVDGQCSLDRSSTASTRRVRPPVRSKHVPTSAHPAVDDPCQEASPTKSIFSSLCGHYHSLQCSVNTFSTPSKLFCPHHLALPLIPRWRDLTDSLKSLSGVYYKPSHKLVKIRRSRHILRIC